MLGRLIKIILVLLVILGGITLFLHFYLEKNDFKECNITSVTKKCPKADAVVVISGGVTKARTEYGIKIFKNKLAKRKIIFSGAAKDKNSISNAEEMANIAIKQGISESRILLDKDAKDTHENAYNVSKIIKEDDKIKSIILVTSGYHQLRAYKEFRNSLDQKIKVYNAPVPEDRDWSPLWFLNPRGWELAVKEFVASMMVKGKNG